MSSELPITAVRMDWGEMPVTVRFSYGAPQTFPFTIVRLWSRDRCGIGEVLVPPSDALKEAAASLIGADGRHLDGLLRGCWDDIPQYLREAFSIALYDLVGRAYSIPLHVLLGGAHRSSVPLMPCIFPESPEHAADRAKELAAQGFGSLKVKIFGDLDYDTQIIRGVRTALGADGYVQADANCGYEAVAASPEMLQKLAEAGLDTAEDLIDGTLDQYRSLRGESQVKIMLDKDARGLQDIGQILAADAADVINLHPDQQGSLSEAVARHSAAAAFDIPAVVGGTGYCGIGTAAYQQLAAVIGLAGPCGELGGAFDHGMPEDLVTDSAGLGVELDEAALQRRRSECWEAG